jgi:biopolymer transport protein ExbD
MTSLIDVMVVLVVFMLIQFEAPSMCGCMSRHIDLPTAHETYDMLDAPLVSVSKDLVLVDGTPAMQPGDLAGPNAHRMDGVFNLLKSKRETWRNLHPNLQHPGHVVLAIDRDVPARIVKSVTMTAASSGYRNIDFMVVAD